MAKDKEKLLKKASADSFRMVPKESQGLTVDRIKKMLPKKTSIAVTEEVVDIINRMEEDTGLPQNLLEEDIATYMPILHSTASTNSLEEFVNAIKYCNLKRTRSNKEAWAVVFPAKYTRLVDADMAIDNHVSAFERSKLVIAIDKEMLIPVHLQYAGYFHSAVKELYNIGVLARGGRSAQGDEMTASPMVRVQALKELTALTKQPEESKLSVTMNPSEGAMSMQQEMNAQLEQLVTIQHSRLNKGDDLNDVQVIDVDFDSIDTVGQ